MKLPEANELREEANDDGQRPKKRLEIFYGKELAKTEKGKDEKVIESESTTFKKCFEDCVAVFHTATPVPGFYEKDGKKNIFEPAAEGGLQDILRSVAAVKTVKTFILTSSMVAMAPQRKKPEKESDQGDQGDGNDNPNKNDNDKSGLYLHFKKS